MELPRDAYQALEDIVGPEYITQEPAIRDTYNQVWANKLVFDEKWSLRPAAVLLPATTEEVQAIVRVCNKYGILFKAFSSGFEIVATAVINEKSVILDMRRMNRILEIDAKNMRAVVEPYVSVGRMYIEAAKYGVILGNIAAGPSAGVMAAAVCHFGSGETMVSTGGLDRNVLGVEWVLPTGDVLRLGSGDPWFSADGPGPSLRGILRGRGGANGGHGVITKVGVKLYPWYGPPEWEHVREVGAPPVHRHPEKVPDGYKGFAVTFPTFDDLDEAQRETAQAEILHSLWFWSLCIVPTLPAEGNDEMCAAFQKLTPEQLQSIPLTSTYTIGANSSREMEYREKCLMKICEKYGGKLLPEWNDPKSLARMFYDRTFSYENVLLAHRGSGSMNPPSPTSDGSADLLRRQSEVADEVFEPYIKSGAISGLGGVERFLLRQENYSAGCHQEHPFESDHFDPVSLEASRKVVAETFDAEGKFRRFGVAGMGGCLQIEPVHHVHQNWGPAYDNYDIWLRKIKAMLDPNTVGEWSAYIPPEYP